MLRRVTDQLMFEIRELTEQDYVDRYAKRHNVVGGTDTASIELLPRPGVRKTESRQRPRAQTADLKPSFRPSRDSTARSHDACLSRRPQRDESRFELGLELPQRGEFLERAPHTFCKSGE